MMHCVCATTATNRASTSSSWQRCVCVSVGLVSWRIPSMYNLLTEGGSVGRVGVDCYVCGNPTQTRYLPWYTHLIEVLPWKSGNSFGCSCCSSVCMFTRPIHLQCRLEKLNYRPCVQGVRGYLCCLVPAQGTLCNGLAGWKMLPCCLCC